VTVIRSRQSGDETLEHALDWRSTRAVEHGAAMVAREVEDVSSPAALVPGEHTGPSARSTPKTYMQRQNARDD
jgi:hypothetical protein